MSARWTEDSNTWIWWDPQPADVCALDEIRRIYGICPLTGRKRALRQLVWATSTVLSQVFTIEEREGICSQPLSGSIWKGSWQSGGEAERRWRRDLHRPCRLRAGTPLGRGHRQLLGCLGARVSPRVSRTLPVVQPILLTPGWKPQTCAAVARHGALRRIFPLLGYVWPGPVARCCTSAITSSNLLSSRLPDLGEPAHGLG